jgi:hypothetical protein
LPRPRRAPKLPALQVPHAPTCSSGNAALAAHAQSRDSARHPGDGLSARQDGRNVVDQQARKLTQPNMLALPGHTSEQRTATNQKHHLTGKAPYKFESISLQRGVRREPDFLVPGCRHSDSTICVGSRWTAPCRTGHRAVRTGGSGSMRCSPAGFPLLQLTRYKPNALIAEVNLLMSEKACWEGSP